MFPGTPIHSCSPEPNPPPWTNPPSPQAADAAVQAELERAGLAVRSFAGHLLREPAEVRLDMGRWAGHFGTLMPFYR